MSKQPDRIPSIMMESHGTNRLITDYASLPSERSQKEELLREIAHDDMNPKQQKHDFKKQKELHEIIRNDDDYDDWDYGTEPIFG